MIDLTFRKSIGPTWLPITEVNFERGREAGQNGRSAGARPGPYRVRGPKKETPWLHWLTTSYLMKGYDRSAVVQSARNSPDGREVFLGDLIAWPWRDPGPVALKQRVGGVAQFGARPPRDRRAGWVRLSAREKGPPAVP